VSNGIDNMTRMRTPTTYNNQEWEEVKVWERGTKELEIYLILKMLERENT